MLKIFRQVALWEAVSATLLFFVAIPVKYLLSYVMEVPEEIRHGAVRIAGSIHGFLVVVFVMLLILCWQSYQWRFKRVITYFLVSLVPIAAFWIERDLQKIIDKKKR